MTGGPDDKPAFLSRESAEAAPYAGVAADDTPTFDQELTALPALSGEAPPRGQGPSIGYEERWRAIARLHARGYTNNQIARHLGYSAPGISLALRQPFVIAEIAAERARLVDDDAVSIMKETSIYAARRIQNAVLNPEDKNGYDAAKFTLEKVTGKARQEVNVESGTLTAFTELLREMQKRGEVVDVTPVALPAVGRGEDGSNAPQDQHNFDAWLTANL